MQGQTILVSTGDAGIGCDDNADTRDMVGVTVAYGLAVNGVAGTP
jgi:hypothetical protein